MPEFENPAPVNEDIWNGWTNNYSRKNYGYITHAWSETECRAKRKSISLCGVKIEDGGGLHLGMNTNPFSILNNQYWEPGCIKCKRILIKRGLMPDPKKNKP